MKFLNYINNLTINISSKDEKVDEVISNEVLLKEIDTLIENLNTEFKLKRNKNRFRLTTEKQAPSLKNKKKEKIIEKWLKCNEDLTCIKKDFLEYLKNTSE